jgi:hypothetical protein
MNWLLEHADPSLEYQVARDVRHETKQQCALLQKRIALSGHGKLLLDKRKADGHWGNGAYNPKWICTHYVLFELMQLGLERTNTSCRESAGLLLRYPKGIDGGINYARTVEYSDVCINGMLLSFGSYFKVDEELLLPVIDYILKVQMSDGGWNCQYYTGATHSSLHTTISVLEGIEEYIRGGYEHRVKELRKAKQQAVEFILLHKLYTSEKTGEVIKDEFFRYTFPIRWKYDILRCLDYFRAAETAYDMRMEEALQKIKEARDKQGKWKGYSQAGKEYYKIERDKWNTLRALRTLEYYQ